MIGEFKTTDHRRGTYTEKLYDGNGKLDFLITSKCVWVSHGELLESREPGPPSQSAITKLGIVDNTWGIEYNSTLFAGACIATVKYVKVQFSFLTAYPTEGTEKLWYIAISNPEWTWIKKDAYYDLILAVQRRNDPRRDTPVTFQGFNGQFMIAKVNVDIVILWLLIMEILGLIFVIQRTMNGFQKGIVGILVSQQEQFVLL